MKIEATFKYKEYVVRSTLTDWGEDFEDGCAYEYSAVIFSGEQDIRIGDFKGQILLTADFDQEDFFFLCDSYDSNLAGLAEDITMHEPNFFIGQTIFHLDHLYLEPQYRGKGIGVDILKEIVHRVQSVFEISVCTLRPFPLQYVGLVDVENAMDFRQASVRLLEHCQQHLPIKQLYKGSEYYVWFLDLIVKDRHKNKEG
jgi:GNAT superfamily N-acetyltransferase